MKDDLTEEQKALQLASAIIYLAEKGWVYNPVGQRNWIFKAPGGTLHDMSSLDLTQFKKIEEEGINLFEYNKLEPEEVLLITRIVYSAIVKESSCLHTLDLTNDEIEELKEELNTLRVIHKKLDSLNLPCLQESL